MASPSSPGAGSTGLIEDCRETRTEEVRSVARTLERWRDQILAWHTTRASNGPTEGLILDQQKVKRVGTGFKSFTSYRLRILIPVGWRQLVASQPPHPAETRRSEKGSSVGMRRSATQFSPSSSGNAVPAVVVSRQAKGEHW